MYMRTLDLLGKILSNGYHAEIKDTSYGLLLILKADHPLSSFVGGMIRNDGFKFKYCYNESSGKLVIIFFKDNK
jgi:hypothetical protein